MLGRRCLWGLALVRSIVGLRGVLRLGLDGLWLGVLALVHVGWFCRFVGVLVGLGCFL